MQANVDHVKATQKQFQAVLKLVQSKNDENFFILRNESVQKITEIVGGHLKILPTKLFEIKGIIAALSVCNVQLTQNMIFLQQIQG